MYQAAAHQGPHIDAIQVGRTVCSLNKRDGHNGGHLLCWVKLGIVRINRGRVHRCRLPRRRQERNKERTRGDLLHCGS